MKRIEVRNFDNRDGRGTTVPQTISFEKLIEDSYILLGMDSSRYKSHIHLAAEDPCDLKIHAPYYNNGDYFDESQRVVYLHFISRELDAQTRSGGSMLPPPRPPPPAPPPPPDRPESPTTGGPSSAQPSNSSNSADSNRRSDHMQGSHGVSGSGSDLIPRVFPINKNLTSRSAFRKGPDPIQSLAKSTKELYGLRSESLPPLCGQGNEFWPTRLVEHGAKVAPITLHENPTRVDEDNSSAPNNNVPSSPSPIRPTLQNVESTNPYWDEMIEIRVVFGSETAGVVPPRTQLKAYRNFRDIPLIYKGSSPGVEINRMIVGRVNTIVERSPILSRLQAKDVDIVYFTTLIGINLAKPEDFRFWSDENKLLCELAEPFQRTKLYCNVYINVRKEVDSDGHDIPFKTLSEAQNVILEGFSPLLEPIVVGEEIFGRNNGANIVSTSGLGKKNAIELSQCESGDFIFKIIWRNVHGEEIHPFRIGNHKRSASSINFMPPFEACNIWRDNRKNHNKIIQYILDHRNDHVNTNRSLRSDSNILQRMRKKRNSAGKGLRRVAYQNRGKLPALPPRPTNKRNETTIIMKFQGMDQRPPIPKQFMIGLECGTGIDMDTFAEKLFAETRVKLGPSHDDITRDQVKIQLNVNQENAQRISDISNDMVELGQYMMDLGVYCTTETVVGTIEVVPES